MIVRLSSSLCMAVCLLLSAALATSAESPRAWLASEELPELPDDVGVAGPFVGVSNDALLVAGGANFPRPVWEREKQWHDAIHVLARVGTDWQWCDGGTLPRPIAYGAVVSTSAGVVCMGGNNATETFADVFLLRWNPAERTVERLVLPSLPQPCAYGQAASIGTVVYLAGGQSGHALDTAMDNLWALDLARLGKAGAAWRTLPVCPGGARAFNVTVAQHDGFGDGVYVLGGRRAMGDAAEFLADVWEFIPTTSAWRPRAPLPRSVAAGTAIGFGQSHVFVLGGDDGSLFDSAGQRRDAHPGFPTEALAYHTITDTWTSAGALPLVQITTPAVMWNGRAILASGEVRPRVRTPQIMSYAPVSQRHHFGGIDYAVLVLYLVAVVGIGVYFARKNTSTDEYFRGGKQVAWWAAGCSIFATMLSSLTFTGIPSKAFAQDWVYALGNLMIPVVAVVAVRVALPFFRRLDVTSAYEYLERRFSRSVRWFGSASFTLFHVFRIAVVMSLTALTLAVATPLTPAHSVLLMGGLCIMYCTFGGIEAVIWTDTMQTFVLFGGAIFAMILLLAGAEGGATGFWDAAMQGEKLHMANFHWDATSAQLSLFVVIVGAAGQNLSSYTADQAVVQRYMTTPDERLAARAIWTNAALAIPSTFLFFGIGTALFVFYRSHPERLDATITTDQVFPLFIATETPTGVAGLIVAGIFAAAQSTISTSMNSTATTIVTDFLRPLRVCRTERSYLSAARFITVLIGLVGTGLGLVFIDPRINSLFDAFITAIGLVMGALGGLFALGVLTRRAHSLGAMAGALVGAGVMVLLWQGTPVNGYLYTSCGIATCFVVGYLVSIATGRAPTDLAGLTIYDTSVETEPSCRTGGDHQRASRLE